TTHHTAPSQSTDSLRVADLSTLWAGPLCGSLFAACGADVTKVSSTARPDGALAGHGAWYEHLNRHKTHLEVALDTPSGRRALEALIAGADVVIESARPRGLEQLGIVAESLVASRTGPQVWISIPGHGRRSPRVAFGDDAAVAGGLVVTDDTGPWFCADAVADPLSGIAAFTAALECLVRRDYAVVDVAMSGVAAAHAAPDAHQTGTPTRLTVEADRDGR
ncbi:MAG: CoA transferase, partial [Actinomycetes bacterium]